MGIREILFEAWKDFGFKQIRICYVKEVTPAEGICTVKTLDTDIELIDVRLRAESGAGFLCIPSVGSCVIIGSIAPSEHMVLMYSGLMNIQMLDGSYGGLVKSEAVTNKLNAIENKVNDLITWATSHSHPNHGVPPTQPTPDPLSNTIKTSLENDEITHGKADAI